MMESRREKRSIVIKFVVERGWSAEGGLRELESSGGRSKEIEAYPAIIGPAYMRRTCCALRKREVPSESRSGQSPSSAITLVD